MNPLFVATPSREELARALEVWPELTGKRLQPLLVTAFGDIYVKLESGEVWVADPLALQFTKIAQSVQELEKLFADRKWGEERLIAPLALLANERGLKRAPHQVFSVAPHPCFSGKLRVENLLVTDLDVWHHLCAQFRAGSSETPVGGRTTPQ